MIDGKAVILLVATDFGKHHLILILDHLVFSTLERADKDKKMTTLRSTYKFIVLYGTTCAFINQYFLRYNNRYYVFVEKYPKLFGKLIYRRKFIDSHPIDFYVPIWRFYVRDNILYKYEFVAQESSIRGVDYSVNCKINLVD